MLRAMTIPGRSLAVGVAIAAATLVLFQATAGSAQVRVAVVPFEGPGATGARRQVQRALEGDRRVSTVDLDRVDSTAGRVGAGSGGSTGIRDLAQELEARMIVQGTVSGRGRRRRISLTALDANGQQVATASGAMRGNGVERAVRSLLDDGLSRLPPPPREQTEAPPVLGGGGGGGGGGRREIVDDEGELDREGSGGGGGGSSEPGDWDTRAPLLEVQVGVVPRSRETDITFQDSRHGRYSAWYPELAARALVRPFNADPSILRGLYGRFFFAHAVGLASRVDSTGQPVENTFFRLDFAAGLLFPLADIVDLGVEFGAGWDTYTLGRNPLLESAEYVYLRPAVVSRFRILRELLVIGAEVGLRPALGRGNFSVYGNGGDTIGFDVGGSLGGGVALAGTIGLTYALTIQYVNYWLSFSDASDPSMAGSSGTDGGVRIGILLGLGIW